MSCTPREPGRTARVLLFCAALLLPALSAAEEAAAPETESAAVIMTPAPATPGSPAVVVPETVPVIQPPHELVGPAWPADPAPARDARWDWVQTDTGEWLKGRIRSMRNASLEFDSDKFEVVSIDWEDVAQLRSARMMSVFFDQISVENGYLSTEEGMLVIEGVDRRQLVPFQNIVSIGSGSEKEKDLWSADVSFSANLRAGNSDQIDSTTMVDVMRRTARSSLQFKYHANYSKQNSEVSSDDNRFQALTDRLITRDWFVRPLSIEFFHDELQNIDKQWTVGVGGGYFIHDDFTTRWVVVAGPGYQQTEYGSAIAGEDRIQKTPALLLGTDYSREVSSEVDVAASYQLTLVNEDSGRALHHVVTSVDIDLTKLLDLRLAVTLDRIETPRADSLGLVPEKNDLRMTIGFDYEI